MTIQRVTQGVVEVVQNSVATTHRVTQQVSEVVTEIIAVQRTTQQVVEFLSPIRTSPISFEDPCSITQPRMHIKVSPGGSYADIRVGTHPLRESVELGGFKEPRIVSMGMITRAASDPITGSLPVQQASVVLADTDWRIRALSSAREGLRNSDAQIYLTSKQRSLLALPPRVLFSGKVYTDSSDENLLATLVLNDILGVSYALFAEEKKIPQRIVSKNDFINAPESSLGKGIPIIAGTLQPRPDILLTQGVGVVDGVYVGRLTLGGTSSPPTGTDLATIVGLLTTSAAAGTLYTDYGWRIGYGDALTLQSYYDSHGSIPSDFDGLAAIIGESDLRAWLGETSTTGGNEYEVVVAAGHAIKEMLAWSGNPAIWVGDTQVTTADLGVNVLCPQISGDTTWGAAFATPYTDLVGTDGETYRYTLILFPVGGSFASTVASGTKVHFNASGMETVGDTTGTLITDYFDQYYHILTQFIIQNYKSGLWASAPQYTYADSNETTIDRVNLTSFTDAKAVAEARMALRLATTGYVGAFVLGSGGALVSVRDIIGKLNVSGGCFLAMNTYGQLSIKKIPLTRAEFLTVPYDTVQHRVLRDKVDILPGFSVTPMSDWQANRILYSYAYDYSSGSYERQAGAGGNVTPLQDDDSIGKFGTIEKLFEFSLIHDDTTALDLASYFLDLLKNCPQVATYKRRGLCGLEDDVLQGVPITHYNGRGDGGWVERGCLILSQVFDPTTLTTTFTALDVDHFVPAEEVVVAETLRSDPVATEVLYSDSTGEALVTG